MLENTENVGEAELSCKHAAL